MNGAPLADQMLNGDPGLQRPTTTQEGYRALEESGGLRSQIPLAATGDPAQATAAVSFTPSLLPGLSRTSSVSSASSTHLPDLFPSEPATTTATSSMIPAVGGKGLEVGYQDSTLGWLSVRASTAPQGELQLSIGGTGERSTASLHEMMPDLKNYLDQHGIATNSLTAFDHEHRMVNAPAAVLQSHSGLAGLADTAMPAGMRTSLSPLSTSQSSPGFQQGADHGGHPPDSSSKHQQRPTEEARDLAGTSVSSANEPRRDARAEAVSPAINGNNHTLSVRI